MEGRTKAEITALLHPRTGFVSKEQFLTIAAVLKWLGANAQTPVLRFRPEKFLPKPDAEVISPEDRARRADRLKDVARVIRETVKAKTIGRPSAPKPMQVNDDALRMASWLGEDSNLTITQHHDPEELLRGLKNLEAHKQPHRQSA